jgi:hypothetical protein
MTLVGQGIYGAKNSQLRAEACVRANAFWLGGNFHWGFLGFG